MWYTILITLVVDLGGLVLVYLLLRDRVRRAVATDTRVAEIREEVSRLLVELNQATDRNIALMEDKITALNEAISTADKKIGLLRRETEKHDVGAQVYSRLAEGRRVRGGERRDAGNAANAAREQPWEPMAGPTEVPESATGGTPPQEEPPQPAKSRQATQPRAEPAALAVELSPASGQAVADIRDRVMMLFRAGFSPSLIATRVGAPRGEVELIISLEQRKGQA